MQFPASFRLDYGGDSQKKLDTMRFTHNEVNCDVTYDDFDDCHT